MTRLCGKSAAFARVGRGAFLAFALIAAMASPVASGASGRYLVVDLESGGQDGRFAVYAIDDVPAGG